MPEDDETVYLARKTVNRITHYYIRESYRDHGVLRTRDLFYLGTDPSGYIVYPGGYSFYIDEQLVEDLRSQGVKVDYHELENLFRPFLDQETRNTEERFDKYKKYIQKDISREEEEKIRTHVHLFDKRRLHYLKYCQIDQTGLGRVPFRCFRVLLGKSRDEIEQFLMERERALRPFEWKEYIYAIFNLQRFFKEMWAKVLPQALDQEKVDGYFIREICRLNSDEYFWVGMKTGDVLHPYLVRYVIQFFDNKYGTSSYFEDYIYNFMNKRRRYQPPPAKGAMGFDTMAKIFGSTTDVLKKMSRRELTRLYRKKAKELHPDKGGEHEVFVKLSEAYRELLQHK